MSPHQEAFPVRLKQAFNLKANTRDIFIRQGSRYEVVDGLRALSILWVILFHCMSAFAAFGQPAASYNSFVKSVPWFLQWMLIGDRGVDIFFTLSGFLIAAMLFSEHQKSGDLNFKRFFIRRFLRLAPAYYCLILFFVLISSPEQDKTYFWTFVFYINNFFDYEYQYINYGWSLAVEEQFYLTFFLFVSFLFFRIKNKLIFLLGMYITSFLVLSAFYYYYSEFFMPADQFLHGGAPIEKVNRYLTIIYDNLYTRFGAFVPGIIVAYLYFYHKENLQARLTAKHYIALRSLAGLLLMALFTLPVFEDEPSGFALVSYHIFLRGLLGLAVAMIIFASIFSESPTKGVTNRILSSSFWYPISQLSYGMFLINPFLIGLSFLFLKNAFQLGDIALDSWILLTIVSMIPIFFVSVLVYIFIERPFMKLR